MIIEASNARLSPFVLDEHGHPGAIIADRRGRSALFLFQMCSLSLSQAAVRDPPADARPSGGGSPSVADSSLGRSTVQEVASGGGIQANALVTERSVSAGHVARPDFD